MAFLHFVMAISKFVSPNERDFSLLTENMGSISVKLS